MQSREAQTHDTAGREYARLSRLKPGDRIEVGDGFDCMAAGAVVAVEIAGGFACMAAGAVVAVESVDDAVAGSVLCVPCAAGRHALGGQLADDGDHLIGIYPAGGGDAG